MTMKGVFFSSKLPNLTEIRDLDIPEPGDDEILVKNVAVASNPKDWKVPMWMPEWEAVEGNDIAGTVEKVGKNVSEFKEGDRVAAFTVMRTNTKYGAYAEYSVSPAHTAWHLADTTSYEDAATLPLAVMTAAIGLFRRLGLQEPPTSGQGKAEGVVVVNGASSSVGAFIVQLAKRAGYTVVGIAGQSADVPKSLGADYIVDYRGKSAQELGKAVKDAVAQSGKKIVGVYDAVSTEATVEMLAYEVLQPEGGKITTVLPAHDNGEGLTVKNVTVDRTMVGTAHQDSDRDFAKKWYRQIGKWLDEGSFKPNKVKLMPDGLDSVNEGVHLLKDNKVNGVKLVYRIADSKCLKK